ncbi:MAG: dihydroneopterin aldolase [Nitriliruptorales bacterium]|nr:dihydroneopterin aldolase [Nitriliruptorales bacterium]
MDRIEIRGLRAFGRHGVLESEKAKGQTFVIDLALELDLSRPASTDLLADTVDYGRLAERVAGVVTGTHYDLIEALASRLAELALEEPAVRAVTVRVGKPEAPMDVQVDDVAVVLRRHREPVQ